MLPSIVLPMPPLFPITYPSYSFSTNLCLLWLVQFHSSPLTGVRSLLAAPVLLWFMVRLPQPLQSTSSPPLLGPLHLNSSPLVLPTLTCLLSAQPFPLLGPVLLRFLWFLPPYAACPPPSSPCMLINVNLMQIRLKSSITKPKLLLCMSVFCFEIEPACFKESSQTPGWQKAMVDEFNKLIANDT